MSDQIPQFDDEDVDLDERQPWYESIEDCDDSWQHWLQPLHFPRRGYSPLDAELEHGIENMIIAADAQRLAKIPTTKRFTEMWARFRKHHINLDDDWGWRRNRYLIWRAAALKVLCDAGNFQDEIDAAQAYTKLAETYHEFRPYQPDDRYTHGDSNFWKQSGVWTASPNDRCVRKAPHPLTEYAEMVLTLMKVSAPVRERPRILSDEERAARL